MLCVLKIPSKFGVVPQFKKKKSKSYSRLGSGSGSWFYFGFQYQSYISYIEDTHQILFGSANSFESYCVHSENPRTYVQPDRQTEIFTSSSHMEYVKRESIVFCSFYFLRHTKHEHSSKGENFFIHSCNYNIFHILRMWWDSKKPIRMLREYGIPELSTELLDLKKNLLQNCLGMFKVLQFLRFWVYRKILLDFFVELIRGGGGGSELSTELLD